MAGHVTFGCRPVTMDNSGFTVKRKVGPMVLQSLITSYSVSSWYSISPLLSQRDSCPIAICCYSQIYTLSLIKTGFIVYVQISQSHQLYHINATVFLAETFSWTRVRYLMTGWDCRMVTLVILQHKYSFIAIHGETQDEISDWTKRATAPWAPKTPGLLCVSWLEPIKSNIILEYTPLKHNII